MTAIVGIVEDGKVWIGADSAGVGGMQMSLRSDPKVFRNGEFLIGYTSSFRMGQILEHHLTPPAPYEGESGVGFMVRRFIPAVKSVFAEHGYERKREGEEYGGTFLVGYRGELYEIESDYQVARHMQPYYACGCGMDLALGSLHATQDFELSAEERVEKALSAAAAFSAGVRRPFHVMSVSKPECNHI